jgi:hypothetical protein
VLGESVVESPQRRFKRGRWLHYWPDSAGSFRGQSASFVARRTLVLFPNLLGQSGQVRFADLPTRLAGNRVELPGIKKEEIGVTFADGVLTIEGERKFENEEKKNEWYRNERTYGKFVRTVPVPEGVKATDIKATFEGGVLEIAVPLPATAAAVPTKVEVTGAEEKKTVKAA